MYSKALTKNLAARLAEFYDRLEGGEIDISHQDELVLLEFRKEALISQMAEWDSPNRWKNLKEALEKYENYADLYEQFGRQSDMVKRDKALEEIKEIAAGGYLYEFLGWKELLSVASQITKTKDSEINRRSKAREALSEQHVSMILGAMINSVQQHVTNEDEKRRIFEDLRRLNIKV